MRQVHILSLILIILLVTATASLIVSQQTTEKEKDPVYVGVSFCGNTVAEAKLLIDKVKGYTNLFVLHSGQGPVSKNETAAREIVEYAIDAGLNVILNLGTRTRDNWLWQIKFYNSSREKYGDKFLGVYYDDEPAGIPFDWDWTLEFTKNSSLLFGENRLSVKSIHYRIEMANITGKRPENYTEEAQWYSLLIKTNMGYNNLKQYHLKTFTSDYLLYWFDYKAGYDTLLAQIGWNHSINQDISLVRGAARMQNKDWGVIMTWKYRQSPFLDTGENIYSQMVTAYNAGAKYILIFNYPYNNTYPWANGALPSDVSSAQYTTENPYGVMTDEHFQALEKFWTQTVAKTSPNSPQAEAAYVLPKDYGWGMRTIDDKIWGFWGPDEKTPLLWVNSRKLLEQYGLRLDIIYDDPAFPITGKYSKLYYWNETV